MTAENGKGAKNSRNSPRSMAQIQVDVDVAGSPQSVILTTRDIGTGGVYLRTTDPAPLWKRVSIKIQDPDGKLLEIAGEVVRRMTPEQAKAKNYSPGMAVAFDEVSRGKHKELAALVTKLAALEAKGSEPEPQPTSEPAPEPAPEPTPEPAAAPEKEPAAEAPKEAAPTSGSASSSRQEDSAESKADKLLEELDALLNMDD